MKFSPDYFLCIFDKTIFKLVLKQPNHKSSRHVKSFFSVVISIIFVNFT